MTDPAIDRYFFVHLQKTGGTTLIHRLRRRFHSTEIYPNATDGTIERAVISIENLRTRWEARHNEIRIVTGHFPLCTADLLGGGFKTLTVLREPVERTLSYLRHHRESTPADRDKPLEAIYDDPFRFHGLIHNHMVKMLSLTTEAMTDGALTRVECDETYLRRAKRNLECVNVVGLQERFGEFWDELLRKFSWQLGEPARSNESQPFAASQSFRHRIAMDNELDADLYEYAQALHAQAAKRPRHIGIA